MSDRERSPYSPLGLSIRHLRDLRGVSQRAVGKAIGRSQNWVSCLERGREEACRSEVMQIAMALRADEDQTRDLVKAWEASSLPRAVSGAAA